MQVHECVHQFFGINKNKHASNHKYKHSMTDKERDTPSVSINLRSIIRGNTWSCTQVPYDMPRCDTDIF